MLPAPLPADEALRLANLRHYNVLDSVAEQDFDDITSLISHICSTPISLITFVDESRQWFKSRVGIDVSETHRDFAFCSHTILQRDVFVINNALDDLRFSDNPFVIGGPKVRFYAGAPLVTPEGFALGTLCAVDKVPRELTPEQIAALKALARQVVSQLELRYQLAQRQKAEAELQRAHNELEKRVKERTRQLAETNTVLLDEVAIRRRAQDDIRTLLTDLRSSNAELTQAYEANIEGWSRALDLRDRETEGHCQRVAEMAVRLAQAIGLTEDQIVHVRRGALLHDIGKMGVPDGVLLKPGPLDAEERALMELHPLHAYAMLSPIDFLQQALDIPYCHHEKWDGTGYPRCLKGDAIPIAARLFALADVWDALRSDRPYRKAWSEPKVREHIRSLAGTHFDPSLTEIFLDVVMKDAAKSQD